MAGTDEGASEVRSRESGVREKSKVYDLLESNFTF